MAPQDFWKKQKFQTSSCSPAASLESGLGLAGSPAEGSSSTPTLTQVALPGDERGAVRTLVLGDVLAVLLLDVYFHGAALGEARVAHVAFVGLLACGMMTKTALGREASPHTPQPPQRTLELKACLLFPGSFSNPFLQRSPPVSTKFPSRVQSARHLVPILRVRS